MVENLTRVSVPALDEMLGRRLDVLDDGFVRVVDYMGSDSAIVQAARVSYGTGTRQVREDRALIRYLLRNAHTTPFEMCELKLHVRVPMDTWRQWIRHRTASVNEYSTRYSVAIDAVQRTAAADWRTQATENRQGSASVLEQEIGERLSISEAEVVSHARRVYNERLAAGVAREQARKDLPLSTYTEAYWKIDLHNLLHFLRLRLDSHAQYEIRQYANRIGNEIVSKWCPIAWQAFQEYVFDSLTFSSVEARILGALVTGQREAAIELATTEGLIVEAEGCIRVTREGRDMELKLERLGIRPPWLDAKWLTEPQ